MDIERIKQIGAIENLGKQFSGLMWDVRRNSENATKDNNKDARVCLKNIQSALYDASAILNELDIQNKNTAWACAVIPALQEEENIAPVQQATIERDKDFIQKIIDLYKVECDSGSFSEAVGCLCEQYLKAANVPTTRGSTETKMTNFKNVTF